jgi:hypothetical protein
LETRRRIERVSPGLTRHRVGVAFRNRLLLALGERVLEQDHDQVPLIGVRARVGPRPVYACPLQTAPGPFAPAA